MGLARSSLSLASVLSVLVLLICQRSSPSLQVSAQWPLLFPSAAEQSVVLDVTVNAPGLSVSYWTLEQAYFPLSETASFSQIRSFDSSGNELLSASINSTQLGLPQRFCHPPVQDALWLAMATQVDYSFSYSFCSFSAQNLSLLSCFPLPFYASGDCQWMYNSYSLATDSTGYHVISGCQYVTRVSPSGEFVSQTGIPAQATAGLTGNHIFTSGFYALFDPFDRLALIPQALAPSLVIRMNATLSFLSLSTLVAADNSPLSWVIQFGQPSFAFDSAGALYFFYSLQSTVVLVYTPQLSYNYSIPVPSSSIMTVRPAAHQSVVMLTTPFVPALAIVDVASNGSAGLTRVLQPFTSYGRFMIGVVFDSFDSTYVLQTPGVRVDADGNWLASFAGADGTQQSNTDVAVDGRGHVAFIVGEQLLVFYQQTPLFQTLVGYAGSLAFDRSAQTVLLAAPLTPNVLTTYSMTGAILANVTLDPSELTDAQQAAFAFNSLQGWSLGESYSSAGRSLIPMWGLNTTDVYAVDAESGLVSWLVSLQFAGAAPIGSHETSLYNWQLAFSPKRQQIYASFQWSFTSNTYELVTDGVALAFDAISGAVLLQFANVSTSPPAGRIAVDAAGAVYILQSVWAVYAAPDGATSPWQSSSSVAELPSSLSPSSAISAASSSSSGSTSSASLSPLPSAASGSSSLVSSSSSSLPAVSSASSPSASSSSLSAVSNASSSSPLASSSPSSTSTVPVVVPTSSSFSSALPTTSTSVSLVNSVMGSSSTSSSSSSSLSSSVSPPSSPSTSSLPASSLSSFSSAPTASLSPSSSIQSLSNTSRASSSSSALPPPVPSSTSSPILIRAFDGGAVAALQQGPAARILPAVTALTTAVLLLL